MLAASGSRRAESARCWKACVFVGTLVLALLTAIGPAFAQAKPAAAAVAVAPLAPVEEEAPDSPRASMRAFFDLAGRGRFGDAALYLEIPRGQDKRGPELARRLYDVLGQRLLVDVEQLSGLATGKKDDTPGTQDLGRIRDVRGHAVLIRIVRKEARTADEEPRWVFNQATVQHVDALYADLGDRWMRDHLPEALVRPGPLSIYYWQWLAVPLLAALALALGKLLTWVTGLAARRLLARWSASKRLLVRLRAPATFGWALAGFWIGASFLALTLRAEETVGRILRALGAATFFWALYRSVIVAGDEIAEAAWARPRPSVRSLASVGVRLGKVVVFALALAVFLSELGYPVTSIVAGLGIGGVALALAAQKTVENLFGSVSILADQPFRVGDLVRVDGVEGTVESIGLRSTRLRTADRTLVVFPNGKLADMKIESLAERDRLRFFCKLQVARGARPRQLGQFAASLRARLGQHEQVKSEDVSVYLSALGDWSYDLEVTAMVSTTEAAVFAAVRGELYTAILEELEANGLQLSTPLRAEPTAAATTLGKPS